MLTDEDDLPLGYKDKGKTHGARRYDDSLMCMEKRSKAYFIAVVALETAKTRRWIFSSCIKLSLLPMRWGKNFLGEPKAEVSKCEISSSRSLIANGWAGILCPPALKMLYKAITKWTLLEKAFFLKIPLLEHMRSIRSLNCDPCVHLYKTYINSLFIIDQSIVILTHEYAYALLWDGNSSGGKHEKPSL